MRVPIADQAIRSCKALRGNWIERLGRGRQTQVCNIQQLATDAQPLFDLKRVIKVRVVDQPFPSD